MQEKLRPLASVCGVEWYDTVESKQPYSRGDLQDLKNLFTLMTNLEEAFLGISLGFKYLREESSEHFDYIGDMQDLRYLFTLINNAREDDAVSIWMAFRSLGRHAGPEVPIHPYQKRKQRCCEHSRAASDRGYIYIGDRMAAVISNKLDLWPPYSRQRNEKRNSASHLEARVPQRIELSLFR